MRCVMYHDVWSTWKNLSLFLVEISSFKNVNIFFHEMLNKRIYYNNAVWIYSK
jgi:hypothetical protein